MTTTSLYSKLKLVNATSERPSISFYKGGKRYRFTNAKALGLDIYPSRVPSGQKESSAYELLYAFKAALDNGWSPIPDKSEVGLLVLLNAVKPDPNYTEKYKSDFQGTLDRFREFVKSRNVVKAIDLNEGHVLEFLKPRIPTPSSYNHERKRLSTIISLAYSEIGIHNPVKLVKRRKEKATMHKRIDNVQELLMEMRDYNENLFLCCLLTYSCLLRPHQEIRQLKWSDFSSDLSYISLSGCRNKSGKNRVVPVPEHVLPFLQPTKPDYNIFTGKPEPYAAPYFKVLWRRFSQWSQELEEGVTLYSFRHTAAIDIYTRTESLPTLQAAMGHSNPRVTLGYLRNMQVLQLEADVMPSLDF